MGNVGTLAPLLIVCLMVYDTVHICSMVEAPTREKLKLKFLETGSGLIGFLFVSRAPVAKEIQREEGKLKLFVLNQIISRCVAIGKSRMDISTVKQYLLSAVALLCTQTENINFPVEQELLLTKPVVKDRPDVGRPAVKINCRIREDVLLAKKTSYIAKSSETVIVY